MAVLTIIPVAVADEGEVTELGLVHSGLVGLSAARAWEILRNKLVFPKASLSAASSDSAVPSLI